MTATAHERGHSSLMGALDVQIAVIKDANDNVVATLELAKDMEVGLRFVSRLEKVELGKDADGDPVTSLAVREVADDVAPKKGKKTSERRSDDVFKVKRAIDDAYDRLADAIETTPGFDGKPVKKVETSKLRDEVKVERLPRNRRRRQPHIRRPQTFPASQDRSYRIKSVHRGGPQILEAGTEALRS